MTVVRIETQEVERMLTGLEASISTVSMEEFLKDPVAAFLRERASERFASSGDDASGAWAPLADMTMEDRLRRGLPGGPPLVATGGLYAFLTGTSGVVENQGEDTRLTFPGEGGTEEAKFATAQRGMNPNPLPGHAPIPAREVAAVNERDAGSISELLNAWIEAKLRTGI